MQFVVRQCAGLYENQFELILRPGRFMRVIIIIILAKQSWVHLEIAFSGISLYYSIILYNIISIVVNVIYCRFILFVFSSHRCSITRARVSVEILPGGSSRAKIIIVVTLRRPYDPAVAVTAATAVASDKSTMSVVYDECVQGNSDLYSRATRVL